MRNSYKNLPNRNSVPNGVQNVPYLAKENSSIRNSGKNVPDGQYLANNLQNLLKKVQY